jgi:hypothetical protein
VRDANVRLNWWSCCRPNARPHTSHTCSRSFQIKSGMRHRHAHAAVRAAVPSHGAVDLASSSARTSTLSAHPPGPRCTAHCTHACRRRSPQRGSRHVSRSRRTAPRGR